MRRGYSGGYSRPPASNYHRNNQAQDTNKNGSSSTGESYSGNGNGNRRGMNYSGPPGPSSYGQATRQLSPDEAAALETYRAALRTLTFNSRPIIENLTLMARERAKIIPGPLARATLDHLVMVPPQMKTPALFLIDSICKSICDPYINSFIKHGLVSAFVRVFGEVSGDATQRRDMLRVLPTWHGLFPAPVVAELESKLTPYLQPGEALLPPPAHQQRPAAAPAFKPETLKLLNDLLAVFSNPPGPHISGIVNEIFKRLSKTGELSHKLLDELDGEARLPDKRRVIALLQKTLSSGDPFKSSASNAPAPRQAQQTPQAQPQTVPALPFELPPNFQIDLSLLNSIAEITAKTSATASPAKKSKHFQMIPLNSADLLKPFPGLHEILYADLPLQCKNCALRFPETPEGQARLTAHLDSHFRRNMRLKERSKRVLARDWFGNEEDWRSGRSRAVETDAKVAIFEEAQPSESEQSGDEFALVQDEEKEVTCAVCHENIPVEWGDEQDAWIVKKAVQQADGSIVHSNCLSKPETKRPRRK